MNRFELRIIRDWKWVAAKSWSQRLVILAALLSGLEVYCTFFADNPPLPRGVFAMLSSLVTVAAYAARFFAQRDQS